ncbi:FadR family transcriptional regulator [Nonomuraea sp. K274]|uniref:FadR family transcriptional regulator n=1 Tax=Nonomuraea cypriaca TaxID=1187855 RepID=A0A931AE83_9ACTN|nr:FadR/GntR family transcriptional regulator [Nonomuraea cypriaca]MBF8189489.1 FadR family transcriptional regulator [Nonomuraea cypriaca]
MTSRTQRLVDTLTARIQEGVIRPGERLPTESGLVETYGVSRTVVREAIARLKAAGLIETQHGRGSFVLARPSTTGFDPAPGTGLPDVLDLLDFRMGVEVEAAGLAAGRRTEAALAGLREALDRFAGAAGHPGAAVGADFLFHLRVALATGNRYFGDLLGSLGPAMIIMPRERLRPDRPDFARIVTEHENIYAAIERGDAAGARAAVRVHLANSRARLTTSPSGGPQDVAGGS